MHHVCLIVLLCSTKSLPPMDSQYTYIHALHCNTPLVQRITTAYFVVTLIVTKSTWVTSRKSIMVEYSVWNKPASQKKTTKHNQDGIPNVEWLLNHYQPVSFNFIQFQSFPSSLWTSIQQDHQKPSIPCLRQPSTISSACLKIHKA